jgi:hypothetical protein
MVMFKKGEVSSEVVVQLRDESTGMWMRWEAGFEEDGVEVLLFHISDCDTMLVPQQHFVLLSAERRTDNSGEENGYVVEYLTCQTKRNTKLEFKWYPDDKNEFWTCTISEDSPLDGTVFFAPSRFRRRDLVLLVTMLKTIVDEWQMNKMRDAKENEEVQHVSNR